jgi:ABC-type transport system involved in Fe-S cluster assembly fused permease/ATPase subunit
MVFWWHTPHAVPGLIQAVLTAVWQVGLVSQEPTLFATSIFENIMMGRPDASEKEVYEAARSANAHNFISAMPSGYQTQVCMASRSVAACSLQHCTQQLH